MAEDSKPALTVEWAELTPPDGIADGDAVRAARQSPPGVRLKSSCFEISVERGFDAEVLTMVLRAVSRACC